jgi:hypothetical protein
MLVWDCGALGAVWALVGGGTFGAVAVVGEAVGNFKKRKLRV